MSSVLDLSVRCMSNLRTTRGGRSCERRSRDRVVKMVVRGYSAVCGSCDDFLSGSYEPGPERSLQERSSLERRSWVVLR